MSHHKSKAAVLRGRGLRAVVARTHPKQSFQADKFVHLALAGPRRWEAHEDGSVAVLIKGFEASEAQKGLSAQHLRKGKIQNKQQAVRVPEGRTGHF